MHNQLRDKNWNHKAIVLQYEACFSSLYFFFISPTYLLWWFYSHVSSLEHQEPQIPAELSVTRSVVHWNQSEFSITRSLTNQSSVLWWLTNQITAFLTGLLERGHSVVGVFPHESDIRHENYTEIIVHDGYPQHQILYKEPTLMIDFLSLLSDWTRWCQWWPQQWWVRNCPQPGTGSSSYQR